MGCRVFYSRIDVAQIVVREADQPNAVVDPLQSELLADEHGGDVDFLALRADAPAGGDEAFAVARRVVELGHAEGSCAATGSRTDARPLLRDRPANAAITFEVEVVHLRGLTSGLGRQHGTTSSGGSGGRPRSTPPFPASVCDGRVRLAALVQRFRPLGSALGLEVAAPTRMSAKGLRRR